MSAADVLGAVSDRLVGGVMFHSEHADLCRWLGLVKLAKLHEDGFSHDSACLRKVHRLCIDHLGMTVPEGRQERSHLLDAYHGKRSWDAQPDARAVQDAMADWIEWESGTIDVLSSACRRLWDGGEVALSDYVRRICDDTADELAHARRIAHEMRSCGWDMPHIFEMKY